MLNILQAALMDQTNSKDGNMMRTIDAPPVEKREVMVQTGEYDVETTPQQRKLFKNTMILDKENQKCKFIYPLKDYLVTKVVINREDL